MQTWAEREREEEIRDDLTPYKSAFWDSERELDIDTLVRYIATLEHAVAKLQQRVQDLEEKK